MKTFLWRTKTNIGTWRKKSEWNKTEQESEEHECAKGNKIVPHDYMIQGIFLTGVLALYQK